MAIVREFYRVREDGVQLYRTYSDEYFMIKKVNTDELYEEAIDVETVVYEYEETDIKIENVIIPTPTPTPEPTPDTPEVDEEILMKAQAYDILMGEME